VGTRVHALHLPDDGAFVGGEGVSRYAWVLTSHAAAIAPLLFAPFVSRARRIPALDAGAPGFPSPLDANAWKKREKTGACWTAPA